MFELFVNVNDWTLNKLIKKLQNYHEQPSDFANGQLVKVENIWNKKDKVINASHQIDMN